MKSTIFAVSLLSAATSSVLAQSGADSSPYIPDSGISDNCRKFLVDLDSNAQLATCSNSLLTATSLFSPNGGNSDATSTQITTALRQLCASQSQCSNALITQALTQFSGNCSAELSAGNQLVKSNYDVLYVLSPFTDAVCTKDAATNKYCALEIGDAPAPSTSTNSSSEAGSVSNATQQATQQLTVQTYKAPHLELSDLYISMSQLAKRAVSNLVRRTVHAAGNAHGHNSLKARQANSSTTTTLASSAGDAAALLPNSTTFRQNNLAFLFLSGEMSSAQLCTSCTKNVLASYVAFENDFPYSIGLANSPILGGQVALWKDIGATCGSGFLSSITAQSGSTISSGASQSFVLSSGLTVGAAALAALFFL